MRIWLLTVLLVIASQRADSANILAIAPIAGRSHFNILGRILKVLAARGHEVDVVSHFPLKTPVPRYKDFSVRGTLPILQYNMSMQVVEKLTILWQLRFILQDQIGAGLCEAIFNSETAHKLKNTTKKYDLLIIHYLGTNCMLGFSHLFSIPTVVVVTSPNLPWVSSLIGLPDNPSYIPNLFTSYTARMTFMERLVNTILYMVTNIGFEVISKKESNIIAKRFFGSQLPNLEDLSKNISLVLVNSHFSTHQARPALPNFIEVAGLHIDGNTTISKHFEKSLKTDAKGIIYLSFGTLTVTETFDEKVLNAFFSTFEHLPYKILWKASRERFPKHLKIPNNIQFEVWMPQMGILCHPNVKLFISHGGMLGTSEALYCGVPVLGIPLYMDQKLNMRNSVEQGMAIQIWYEDITENKLTTAINSLLNDPKYKSNVERMSRRFKDRPMSAIDTAMYWIEYVIRHNGAPHLRSIAADMPLYQYYLMDVIAVFLLVGILASFILYKLCLYILLRLLALIWSEKHKKE